MNKLRAIRLSIFLLAAMGAVNAAAQLSVYIEADGNTIHYNAYTGDPRYNCIRVSLDNGPWQGGFCSGGPGQVSSAFYCNWPGTHVVKAEAYGAGYPATPLGTETVTVYAPPPGFCNMAPEEVLFDITSSIPANDRRVLLSNMHFNAGSTTPTYPYPQYQALLAKDRAIPMNLRVIYNAVPASGVQVTLKIIDPPDPSAYVTGPANWPGQPLPGAALSHTDDNKGSKAVFKNNCVPCATYSVTSGANGYIETELDLPSDAVAGDNYQVEATATFSDGTTKAARSGIVTAWKRMFVEKKLMFKRGAPLATDAPVGVTNIIVENAVISATGDEFDNGDVILLMHAPPLGAPKNTPGAYYFGLYRINANPRRFTSDGPQPGWRNSTVTTTNGSTTVTGVRTRFNQLESGDVLGIVGEYRYIITIQGNDTVIVNAPFTFVGTTGNYTIGDPNLADHSFHHYLRMPLDQSLAQSYQREPSVNLATTPLATALTLNDSVVQLSAATLPPPPADYHTVADTMLLGGTETQPAHVFPSAYTEYIVLPWTPTASGRQVLPRARLVSPQLAQLFMNKWFELPTPVPVSATDPFFNATDPQTWFRFPAPANHQLLLIGDTDSLNIANGSANGFLATRPTGGGNREMGSVIVRANTEHAVTVYEHPLRNANVDTVLERTVVHELVHQWSANSGPYNDHCHPYVAYNSTAGYPPIASPAAPPGGLEFCLMSHANEALAVVPTMPAPWDASVIINMVQYFYGNGLTHFHAPSTSNAMHSEYLVIRNTSDPWHP